MSNTIRPFFVNLYVTRRAVGPSENRSSNKPSPRLLDNGIRAVEPSADNRSITTTVRSHSASSSECIQTTTSSWSSKSDTPPDHRIQVMIAQERSLPEATVTLPRHSSRHRARSRSSAPDDPGLDQYV